jgi:hypothetical protein
MHRAMILTAIAWTLTPDAFAQSLAAAKARVPAAEVLHVIDASGATIKGRLGVMTDEEIQVLGKDGEHCIPAADIRRIDWQQRDSILNGVLIGAAIGAAPGIYWLIADPNECSGLCPEEYGAILVGAAIGGLIDRAVHKKITVYSAERSRRVTTVTIMPMLTRQRWGLQVTKTF